VRSIFHHDRRAVTAQDQVAGAAFEFVKVISVTRPENWFRTVPDLSSANSMVMVLPMSLLESFTTAGFPSLWKTVTGTRSSNWVVTCDALLQA
jgi:hypothetical protein